MAEGCLRKVLHVVCLIGSNLFLLVFFLETGHVKLISDWGGAYAGIACPPTKRKGQH